MTKILEKLWVKYGLIALTGFWVTIGFFRLIEGPICELACGYQWAVLFASLPTLYLLIPITSHLYIVGASIQVFLIGIIIGLIVGKVRKRREKINFS